MHMKKVILDGIEWDRLLEILKEAPEGMPSRIYLFDKIKKQLK